MFKMASFNLIIITISNNEQKSIYKRSIIFESWLKNVIFRNFFLNLCDKISSTGDRFSFVDLLYILVISSKALQKKWNKHDISWVWIWKKAQEIFIIYTRSLLFLKINLIVILLFQLQYSLFQLMIALQVWH